MKHLVKQKIFLLLPKVQFPECPVSFLFQRLRIHFVMCLINSYKYSAAIPVEVAPIANLRQLTVEQEGEPKSNQRKDCTKAGKIDQDLTLQKAKFPK